MVYFEDTGSVIEATVDEVWAYRASAHHGPAHGHSARNLEVLEMSGTTTVVSAERSLDGTWRRLVSRSTDFPPLCLCNEEVEGDFAGTRFVQLYRPEGPITRVDVYGDVRSPVFPPEIARARFVEILAGAYDEDVAMMRRLRSGDPSRSPR